MLPVVLTTSSGSAGSATSKATWRYDGELLDGTSVLTDANPLHSFHHWEREIGLMKEANFGLGFFQNGVFRLTWINEIYEHATCDA